MTLTDLNKLNHVGTLKSFYFSQMAAIINEKDETLFPFAVINLDEI